jgi:hypothetical protein
VSVCIDNTYMYVFKCACVFMCLYFLCTQVHVHNCTCGHAYIHTCTLADIAGDRILRREAREMLTEAEVCMYVHIHACVYVAGSKVCLHAYMCACMYVAEGKV